MVTSLRRGLYAVTPDWDDTARLLATTSAIIEGGAVCVQYRHKHADAALRREQAQAVAALCRAHGVCCIVNDDLALARAVGADGVHLGREDGACAAARREAGTDFIIGVSCYDDFARAETAVADGASYVAFGAVFASPTKPAAVAAPLALFARARHALAVPLVGIGGISAANVEALVAAGADLAAVITDIYLAPDPRAQARRIADAFASPASNPL
ncbi:MAG: thiamine phosphate synthase [Rhodocyclaceae bacterium]